MNLPNDKQLSKFINSLDPTKYYLVEGANGPYYAYAKDLNKTEALFLWSKSNGRPSALIEVVDPLNIRL